MIKALKRNQIVIFAIALMLITAGYLNYTIQSEQVAETSSILENEEVAGIGDAKLVSTENVVSNENDFEDESENSAYNSTSNMVQNSTNQNAEETNNDGNETTETSSKTSEDTSAYFTESKLERENMYSEMLESYQTILASSNVSSEQITAAQNEISSINSQKNAIMIAENLIKNKGFEDLVIFVNNESVSVVVRAEELSEAEIAQIQSIIQRELSVEVENIHISCK